MLLYRTIHCTATFAWKAAFECLLRVIESKQNTLIDEERRRACHDSSIFKDSTSLIANRVVWCQPIPSSLLDLIAGCSYSGSCQFTNNVQVSPGEHIENSFESTGRLPSTKGVIMLCSWLGKDKSRNALRQMLDV